MCICILCIASSTRVARSSSIILYYAMYAYIEEKADEHTEDRSSHKTE